MQGICDSGAAKGRPRDQNKANRGRKGRWDSVSGEKRKPESESWVEVCVGVCVEVWEDIPLVSEEEKKKPEEEEKRAEGEKANQEWYLIDKKQLR